LLDAPPDAPPTAPPTKLEYQNDLRIVQHTPALVHLKMSMANGRIEYIPLQCQPIVNTCRIAVLRTNPNTQEEEEEDLLEMLSFPPCLISQYVVQKIKIYNDTPYYVPYDVGFTSPYFKTESSTHKGIVPPHASHIVPVLFHPLDTFDTEKSPARMTIGLMYGLMNVVREQHNPTQLYKKGVVSIQLEGRTQEFLFNARLLGKIHFGHRYLGTQEIKSLILQNQQDKQVEYSLLTNELHESMAMKVVEQHLVQYVPVGEQVHVKITFLPVLEGMLCLVLCWWWWWWWWLLCWLVCWCCCFRVALTFVVFHIVPHQVKF
jgi:hypothetical protein